MSDQQYSDFADLQESKKRPSARSWWIIGGAIVAVGALIWGGVAVFGGGSTSAEPASGGSSATAAAGASTAADTPVAGGTFRFGLLHYQSSIDPHLGSNYADSIIGNQVTDKLTWQDPETNEITPWLATAWESNDDYTEWTFTLRDDVTFSDGTEFTSESVKHNFDQYYNGDPSLEIQPNGRVYLTGYLETLTPSATEVVIRFDRPRADFLQISSFTANQQPGFLADATLAKSAAERQDPANIIGTGPFVYEEWVSQERAVLVQRDDYDWSPAAIGHEGAAYVDRLEFITIPEASVRTGALQSGTVDAILDVQPTDEQSLVSQGYQLLYGRVPGIDIHWSLNTSVAPTNELAVRKAILLGSDRGAIEQTLLTDSYQRSTSAVSQSIDGWQDYTDTALRYDPEEAARLLEEAGWTIGADGIREKDGQKLVVKITGGTNLVLNKPAYESIQGNLKAIGIDLQLTLDAQISADQRKNEFNGSAFNRTRNHIGVLQWSLHPDLGNYPYLQPGTTEYEEIVPALDKLTQVGDPDELEAAAEEAQDLVIEKYALINPIYTPAQVIAANEKVHGIIFDANARNHFVDVWIEQ